MRIRRASPAQTHLVRTYPYGTDPALPGLQGKPMPIINTIRFGVISGQGGQFSNGRLLTGPGGASPATGEFTVSDNDFSTGLTVLTLGENKVISGIDFAQGVSTDATAIAIAAAISRLPGFVAVADTSVVTVGWGGSFDEVDFYAVHYGSKINYTLFTPSNGFLAMGRPAITAPEVTP